MRQRPRSSLVCLGSWAVPWSPRFRGSVRSRPANGVFKVIIAPEQLISSPTRLAKPELQSVHRNAPDRTCAAKRSNYGGRRRQDAGPGLAQLYRLPQTGPGGLPLVLRGVVQPWAVVCAAWLLQTNLVGTVVPSWATLNVRCPKCAGG